MEFLDPPKIERVPPVLRQRKYCCYDPCFVSIGPYHHGRRDLQEVERLKNPLASEYVKDCEKSYEEVYGKVREVSMAARRCYPDHETRRFDEKKFTEMMLLDGCFILQFLVSLSKGESMKGMKKNLVTFIQRDLFLLENQLPYEVLNVLMSLRFDERKRRLLINSYIYSTRMFGDRIENFETKINITEKPEMELPEDPVHLLHIFRSFFVNKIDLICCNRKGKLRYWFSYPPAKELEKMGIRFKRSDEDCFTHITFTDGQLTLPKIIVDDTIVCLLFNLVAYEACYDTSNDYDLGITSYVCFMDSIIDNAQDVKSLRKSRIIDNRLGSDHEVAEIFNEVANLVPNSLSFVRVKERIETHCKNNSTHCKNNSKSKWPWTLVALLAATFVMLSLVHSVSYFWCPLLKRF